MKQCFVPDCNHIPTQKGCTSHRFPSTPRPKVRWIRALRRGDRLPTSFDIVCGCHFSKGSVTPSIFRRDHANLFSPAKARRSRKRLLLPGEPDLMPLPAGPQQSHEAPSTNSNEEEVLAEPLPPEIEASVSPQFNLGELFNAAPVLSASISGPPGSSSSDVQIFETEAMQIDDDSIPVTIVTGSRSKSGCNNLEGTTGQETITEQKEITTGPSPQRIAALRAKHKKFMLRSRNLFRRVANELSFLRKKIEVFEDEKKKAIEVAERKERALEEALEERDLACRRNIGLGNENSSLKKEVCTLKKLVIDFESSQSKLKEEKDLCKLKIKSLESDVKDANKKLDIGNAKIADCSTAIKMLEEDLQRERDRMSAKVICQNDSKVTHYTGLPNKETFHWLLSLFDNYTLKYYTGKNVQKLGRDDQLLMTLMRLKKGCSRQQLGDWFNVSKQTVTNITHTWIDALHIVLFKGFMSEVPSLAKNKATLPECFKEFRNCRMILDCTEVRMAIPKTMRLHNLVYSSYKHYCTLKALVGVAPNGALTFASKLYPGSTSDKAITKDCGVMSVFNPGESVMADRGFLINEFLPEGVQLVRPPFLDTPQFTAAEAANSKKNSQARIHVERAIRRIKLYEILNFIPTSMVPIASKNFQVCVALTALMNPLIKEVEEAMLAECSSDDSD